MTPIASYVLYNNETCMIMNMSDDDNTWYIDQMMVRRLIDIVNLVNGHRFPTWILLVLLFVAWNHS